MIIRTLANKSKAPVRCQFPQSLASPRPHVRQLSNPFANVLAVTALAPAGVKVGVHVLAEIIAVDVMHWDNVL